MEKRAATPGCGTPGAVVKTDNAPRWVIFLARLGLCEKVTTDPGGSFSEKMKKAVRLFSHDAL